MWSMREAETMLTEAQKLPRAALMCYNINACIVWIMRLNMSRHICMYHPNHTLDNDISLSARDIYESWPSYYTRTAQFSFCQHKLNSIPALAASLPFLLTEANMLSPHPPTPGEKGLQPISVFFSAHHFPLPVFTIFLSEENASGACTWLPQGIAMLLLRCSDWFLARHYERLRLLLKHF